MARDQDQSVKEFDEAREAELASDQPRSRIEGGVAAMAIQPTGPGGDGTRPTLIRVMCASGWHGQIAVASRHANAPGSLSAAGIFPRSARPALVTENPTE